jgi:hypothetical protein
MGKGHRRKSELDEAKEFLADFEEDVSDGRADSSELSPQAQRALQYFADEERELR